MTARLARLAIGSALVLATACGREQDAVDGPIELPPEMIVASFGELTDRNGVRELSEAYAAVLSRSGRYLAVLDFDAPFVRVFDRVEDEAWSFGQRGDGPGELRSAYAIAFEGDSVVVVMGSGRLHRYSLDGAWLEGERLETFGLAGMSYARGCQDRSFLYAVPASFAGLDTVPWLHEIDLPARRLIRSEIALPGGVGMNLRFGALNRLHVHGTEEGIWLLHEQRERGRAAGYWIPCDGSPAVVRDQWTAFVPSTRTRTAGEQALELHSIPDTLFAGAAAQGQTVVRAFHWKELDSSVTAIRVMDGDRCAEVELIGEWRLLGLRHDLALLGASDPYPRVHLVDWPSLRSRSMDRPCVG